ncbi:hypothetical protein ACXHP8_05025, partial [Vibrio antiquarius]
SLHVIPANLGETGNLLTTNSLENDYHEQTKDERGLQAPNPTRRFKVPPHRISPCIKIQRYQP